jgi:hypothetical protein
VSDENLDAKAQSRKEIQINIEPPRRQKTTQGLAADERR